VSSTWREKRLWLAALALTAVTYSTLGVARPVTEALRERNLLRVTLVLVFLGVLVPLGTALVRARPGRREVWVLAATALAYGGLFPLFAKPEEAMHLVQYGLLGGLCYLAASARRDRWGRAGDHRLLPGALAVGLTAVLGLGDEVIQYFLPARFFDWRDVGFNAVAGALAVGALVLRDLARRRDALAGRGLWPGAAPGSDPPVST
jgi:hypothetical protein